MSDDSKRRLPVVLKIAVALTFFNSWVLFEELVIDRHGLWRYMPLYEVGVFCTCDRAALLIIIPAAWYGLRRWQRRSTRVLRERKTGHEI